LQRDLYVGDAGVALALIRIGLSSSRARLVGVAVDAAERLWATTPRVSAPGLLIGEAGVGLLYLTLAEILGEPVWLQRAVIVSRKLSRRAFDSPDLMHGAAGRGLFHAWTYEYTREKQDLSAAVAASRFLVTTHQQSPLGPLWPIRGGYGGLEGGAYFGFAHGTAGIAYGLLEIGRVTGVDRVADLCLKVADSLARIGERRQPGALVEWPDSVDGVERHGMWCHGSTGIGLALLSIYEIWRRPSDLGVAREAISSAFQHARQMDPTQCHGLAGLTEAYLDLHEVTRDRSYLDRARTIGNWLRLAFSGETTAGLMISSEQADVFTPDFMVGSAGAAAALARVLRPDRFGYFLRSPQRAFPPSGAR